MLRMMEQLESRLLFIASSGVILADLEAVKAAGATASADLKVALSTAKADMATLRADVRAAHPTSTQEATFKTLQKDEASGATKYRLKVTNILAGGTRDGQSLLSALKRLEAKPTNVAIQGKVQASLAALQGAFSDTVLTNVETTASATVTQLDTDANALATAIPSTQTDVNTFESHLASDLGTISTQGMAIQAAIATLAGNLS